MGKLVNYVTPLHQATSRAYIDRMVDDKVHCMLKAKEYEVEQAPFFIVEDDENNIAIYTVYFKFIKEIFSENATENDIAKDIVDSENNLDFI